MALEGDIPGIAAISLRSIDDGYPRPIVTSPYENWGEMAADAEHMVIQRWLIEFTIHAESVIEVGDLSAHTVWYGPTIGSKAMNIGISILPEYRGRGIGSLAQRLLAEELHEQGYLRVEAATDIANIPEQRALANAGFGFEGVALRAQARLDGVHDLQVWSHVAEEKSLGTTKPVVHSR